MKNIKHYIQLAWKNLTIEPVIFFYLTSVGLISVIRPNLLIDKACKIKLKTLIIINRIVLIKQWKETIERATPLSEVQVIYSKTKINENADF